MVFHWSLSHSKSPKVSRTLLGILADLNDTDSLMVVSTCSLISMSTSPFTTPLGIVPSAPITTGITVTFMFHFVWGCVLFSFLFFFSFSGKVYVVIFSLSFIFLWSAGTPMSTIQVVSLFFFLLTITTSGLLADIVWFVCISKKKKKKTMTILSHFLGQILVCIGIICLYGQRYCTIPSGDTELNLFLSNETK